MQIRCQYCWQFFVFLHDYWFLKQRGWSDLRILKISNFSNEPAFVNSKLFNWRVCNLCSHARSYTFHDKTLRHFRLFRCNFFTYCKVLWWQSEGLAMVDSIRFDSSMLGNCFEMRIRRDCVPRIHNYWRQILH